MENLTQIHYSYLWLIGTLLMAGLALATALLMPYFIRSNKRSKIIRSNTYKVKFRSPGKGLRVLTIMAESYSDVEEEYKNVDLRSIELIAIKGKSIK